MTVICTLGSLAGSNSRIIVQTEIISVCTPEVTRFFQFTSLDCTFVTTILLSWTKRNLCLVLITVLTGVWMEVSERATKSGGSDVCEHLTSRIVMSSSTSPSSCRMTTEEGESQRGRRKRRFERTKLDTNTGWMEPDADKHDVEQ